MLIQEKLVCQLEVFQFVKFLHTNLLRVKSGIGTVLDTIFVNSICFVKVGCFIFLTFIVNLYYVKLCMKKVQLFMIQFVDYIDIMDGANNINFHILSSIGKSIIAYF